ncbi:glycosyltransferase family 4 protein [Yinghuangia seranimata]|uniref:glycosyltransferase family 4 protein n=1 Tax=Yinghuangia seranimata TaxID=408067 RepID=UPI00248C557B|nr:glycosyltransferase family 4 protein [Yinghuangia seranimata]MDI2124559.1 glycosyltransferase family 4 protein [Yinghuangia seranimata]
MERLVRTGRGGPRRPHVTLVVPFLSEFRVPFFRHLEADLDTRGITLVVAYGEPYTADQRARDDVVEVEGAVRLRQRSARIAGRPFVHKRLGDLTRETDVFVVDQALRNMELYPMLVRQRFGRGPIVAMWDHGRTYDRPQSALEQSLKYALTRRAKWFFSYTEGGKRAVVDHGFPAERVTVVQNSVDTTGLSRVYAGVTDEERAELRRRYDLTPGRTGLFVGALSPAKRIPFLIEAAEQIERRLPGFRLLVAGTGPDRGLVAEAAERCSAVVPVGQAFGDDKALLGTVSDVLLVPGLVGLIAVDSFALRSPIVTTEQRWNGPESEYLEHGRNAVVTRNDPASFVDGVVDLLENPRRLAELTEQCAKDADRYTIEEMSRRFADGLAELLTNHGR